MLFEWFTQNSQEYEERRRQPFIPSSFTLKELRVAVPKKAFKRSTVKGVYYVLRDVVLFTFFLWLASRIDTTVAALSGDHERIAKVLRWSMWLTYWYFQGLVGAGIWILGKR